MSHLLRKPLGERGLVHDVTPENAGWGYVGFALHRLKAGERAEGATGGREVILVLVEGRARVAAAGRDWGELGGRMSVFERTPPHSLYLPPAAIWQAVATTDCIVAVCSAPSSGTHPARLLGPDGIVLTRRGEGANTRFIHNIAMEEADVADSLLVTEVYTPAGNWSSYPSHRHDEDDFPRITYLEETYYMRLNPPQGFAFQRVYCEDGSLDETMCVKDHDVTLVPRGHHPCGTPYGYDLYYLNVMAGPRRAWRFVADPDHAWLMQKR
ncbi:5-deoxy-glucuronate isomerase [Pseudoxanthobacter sp.]|uniref:5-deoxy-glucuronate isomerase n=1 Tax=Pseudoxanthobacter sp. TaxID=1925742 RepID=UPI002FDFB3F3